MGLLLLQLRNKWRGQRSFAYLKWTVDMACLRPYGFICRMCWATFSACEAKQSKNQLYQKACDRGDMGGCFNLDNSYNNGLGVPKDHQKANQLFQKACDGGYARGCWERKK